MTEISVIALLDDPVRRGLYDFVSAQGHGVSRTEAAAATGIGRTLAAFHLDRLAEAGLVEATFARPAGRTGPGAGRPAKLYRRAAAEHQVSVPPRDYRAVAELGYQPYHDGGDVRLRNCPFHLLASRHPPLICGMNLALLEGLLSGAAVPGLTARLDPRPDECCVVLENSKNNAN